MYKFFFLIVFCFFFGIFQPVKVLAAVSLDQAAAKITSTLGNRILSAKTEIIKGRKVHVIKSLSPDGRIQHHYVDAETGQLLH